MIHYKPEIIQSVSIGKCKPFDTTSVKLSQVHFSPWHFPVSFAAEDMAVMGDVIIGSLKAFLKAAKEQ